MLSVLGSSSKLAHPNFSEQNRTRDNENASKGLNVAQSVNETWESNSNVELQM
jgi:hypothetical protein